MTLKCAALEAELSALQQKAIELTAKSSHFEERLAANALKEAELECALEKALQNLNLVFCSTQNK